MNANASPFRKLLLILAVSLPLLSCSGSGQQQASPGSEQLQPYPTLDIQPRDIVLKTQYPATLDGLQTVEIRPRLQGYIVEMAVDEGQIVEKGQLLFRLNSEEYEQAVRSAEADVQAAEAAVQTARDEVERLGSLYEQEIISQYRLQSAKNTLKSQQAALAQAKAALENAQVNLGYTSVKSPTDGVIGSIPYRIGSLVSSTNARPLTVVSNISKVYAYFSMSERELLNMAQNMEGESGNKTLQQRVADIPDVNLLLADNSLYEHQGSLRLASGLINSETGSATIRALFPNPQEILRSGGSGSVQIPFQQNGAIVIPKSATYEIQNKRFVYAVTDSNTIESREVVTQTLSTKQLFVVDEGLSTGDRIVTAGMSDMQEGMTIKPQAVDNDSLYQALTMEDQ